MQIRLAPKPGPEIGAGDTVDVWPFCGSGSTDLVLYNGWNTCLVCNEGWWA